MTSSSALSAAQSLPLAGQWNCRLDPQDQGVSQGWFSAPLADARGVNLPGSLMEAGLGDPISLTTPWTGDFNDKSYFTADKYAPYRQPGNIKLPCWLQPEKYYAGAAWYQREIEIPAGWAGKRITLSLERTHWGTQAWIDDRKLGEHNSLSVPHGYDLSNVAPGKHRLTLRIDNRILIPVGPNSHSVSDHTQGNWNGVVGSITLTAGEPTWIEDVRTATSAKDKTVKVTVRVQRQNESQKADNISLSLNRGRERAGVRVQQTPHAAAQANVKITWQGLTGTAEATVSLGANALLWDEFAPNLYDLQVSLLSPAGQALDTRSLAVGLRDFSSQGTNFTINNRPTFLRGTLECCIFPKTGYPPTDVDSWKRILTICRAHGLNHVRFHSWCPPEAAFIAGDEMGFYFQVEGPTWANQGASVGDGTPLDAWLYEETDRILQAYGNHPSFVMMAYGNEPGGDKQGEFLDAWVNHYRAKDARRLYTTGAGWPVRENSDYHSYYGARIQMWGQGVKSRINAKTPETMTIYDADVKKFTKPLVSHEIGQWCVFPNFEEIKKYTGVYKAKNFDIFQDTLDANHMGHLAKDFLIASGKLQALCYKEEIESALRTPGFGGFHLLDLHDFPGQGTALVGVLDPFWEEKGYITAAQYKRFCDSTTLLARLERRYWKSSDTFLAFVDVSHFGAAPLKQAKAQWRIVDDAGKAVRQGTLPAVDVPLQNAFRMGEITCDLKGLPTARRYRLVVTLPGVTENDWDLWVFADQLDTAAPADILVTEELNAAAIDRLRAGGKVLLNLPAGKINTPVQIGFSPAFWNTSWTNYQPPHTLGILCRPEHPVFQSFPTESHQNWQWWDLIHRAAAMHIDHLPPQTANLVQSIDTWFENRRLSLLLEAKVAGGKLMVCSMDVVHDLDARPVARQLRHSLLAYMHSDQFNPTTELQPEQIEALLKQEAAKE